MKQTMKIVIPCAAGKFPVECGDFSGFMRDANGNPVKFVAEPDLAPKSKELRYVSPDCDYDSSMTFREKLRSYNEKFNSDNCNPYNLYPACELYKNSIYSDLVKSYGIDRTYILSAGWGIVQADFLLPMYDITFSSSVKEKYKKRKSSAVWPDFNHLDNGCEDTLCLFGTVDYIDLFLDLTRQYKGKRIVYYNSGQHYSSSETLKFVKCDLSARTNWQNTCARKMMGTNLECCI